MPKAYLKLSNRHDLYLRETSVENLFIGEFLPTAPGDYVKVYLFGLMYAQNGMELDVGRFSRIFQISEEAVIEAWEYWNQRGLINLKRNQDSSEFSVEYVSQIDGMYGKNAAKSQITIQTAEDSEEDNPVLKMINQEIQAIFTKYESLTGKMISSEERRKVERSISTYNILPDIMSFAVEYCVGEDRSSIYQILRTAENWVKEGCTNLAEVKEYIDKHSKRNSYYNQVFREMGWTRLPSPADREMMDRWFDELGFSLKDVLAACRLTAGLRDPSLRYVDKVLENKVLEAGGINTKTVSDKPLAKVSKKILKEYYDYLRSEADRIQDAHIDEACENILEMRELFELENNLNQDMLKLDFSGDGRAKRLLNREQRKSLEEEKRRLLVQNGYSEDYLEKKYRCEECKDTGVTDDGRVCACSQARAEEAFKWNRTRKQ